MYICVLHACSAHGDWKGALDLLEVELASLWVLRIEPGSSGRTPSTVLLTTEPSLWPLLGILDIISGLGIQV